MRLTKHHGLGNDFLVALVDQPNSAELARRLCDRRRGVGADGLIVARPSAGGTDVAMDLRNADGSVAEMSGNGIRCLAQAVLRARSAREGLVTVDTLAGRRTVEVTPTECLDTCSASVAMGEVRPGPDWPPGLAGALERHLGPTARVETADVGNPHLVALVDDPAAVDLAVAGPALESLFVDGVNVEVISTSEAAPDTLELRVWERGVGITEACGTGATAAATLAHRWGLVDERVRVRLPGGEVTVVVGGDGATLVGPATYIATIEVPHG